MCVCASVYVGDYMLEGGVLQIDGCPRGPFALLIQESVVGALTQI